MSTFADFPYEIVETTGENALATWEELKKAGRGSPVVLGEEELANLLVPFDPINRERLEPVENILAKAEALTFPDDLFKLRRDQHAEALSELTQMGWPADFWEYGYEAPLGDWPDVSFYGSGLSVAYDVITREIRPLVRIALLPTDDPTAIPAYMRYGNWNECAPPAYHVAALRAWRDKYGAELVGLSADVINLRVARNPATREEALDLARAQYAYCNDIVDQGVSTLQKLAAGLMQSDWWFFWWD